MAKFTDIQVPGIADLCETFGLSVTFSNPSAVAGIYNPKADFIERDLEHLTDLGQMAGYTFTHNTNDHTFLFVPDPCDIVKMNDPVIHIKSRKEGTVISIDNGLAEIELAGEMFEGQTAKHTHLCLLENLVKV